MALKIIKYPYLPEGREYLYVSEDNEFMQAAKIAAKAHGCRKHATGGAAVKDGKLILTGSNAGTYVSVCPRAYKGYPTGEGYHYCRNYCDQKGHSEVLICNQAKEQGIDLNGADIYLYGHWWCCQNCWNHMIKAGIVNVYLAQGSEKSFNYDYQKEDAIIPPPKLSAYVAGPLTHLKDPAIKDLYIKIGDLLEAAGIESCVPHRDIDQAVENPTPDYIYSKCFDAVKNADLVVAYVGEPSLEVGLEVELANRFNSLVILLSEKDATVSKIVIGSPNVIDHIIFESPEDALNQLQPLLKKFVKTAGQQNVSVKI